MQGFLAMNGTGGMKTIGSEAGTNQITQSPSFNTYVSWVKNNHTYKFGSEFRTEGYPPTVDANTDGVYTFSAAETGQPFQTAPVNCDIAHNYPYAFGPRLGAAYQITPKTVFRLGFGIVYSGTAANNNAAGGLAASSATTVSTSFGVPVTTLSAGLPLSFRPAPWPTYDAGYFPTFPSNGLHGNPGPGPVWMDPNAGRPARQYQWSVGFQREISQNLAVDVTYVGNRGVWWQAPALLNFNAITPERLKSLGLDVTNAGD